MATMLALAVGTLIAVILFSIFLQKRKAWKPLPGPKGPPFIGSALQMDPTGPHKTVNDWVKEYGNIFKMKVNISGIYKGVVA